MVRNQAQSLQIPEVLIRVASYLPQGDVARLACVNSMWFRCLTPVLWRKPVLKSIDQLRKMVHNSCHSMLPETRCVWVEGVEFIPEIEGNEMQVSIKLPGLLGGILLDKNTDLATTRRLSKLLAQENPTADSSRTTLIREIDMSSIYHRWSDVTGTHLLGLLALCPRLESLSINMLRSVAPHNLCTAMYMLSPTLKYLDLSDTMFDDYMLGCLLVNHGPNLIRLNISDTLVTDKGLAEIASKCGNLIEIQMQNLIEVCDDGIRKLLEGCPQLVTIEADGCPSVNCWDVINKINEKSQWEDVE
ncbi:hypothetical protein EV182_005538 [Spiromyces aspiralis]|uniref:Uncharacterized protein n=1 Tax=Spiromyces aspiralis TaxID=68401 RepID=A0ACC1HA58_9FUNG|nr:hypothetical protein EV182_005538 [Spiromyces aspiralis]